MVTVWRLARESKSNIIMGCLLAAISYLVNRQPRKMTKAQFYYWKAPGQLKERSIQTKISKDSMRISITLERSSNTRTTAHRALRTRWICGGGQPLIAIFLTRILCPNALKSLTGKQIRNTEQSYKGSRLILKKLRKQLNSVQSKILKS